MTEEIGIDSLPMITVIIPMRNEEEYIGRCLESIMEQGYPKKLTEVLVVDGGSSDGSVRIVKELAREHRNIRLLGGEGVNCPAAMNVGIRSSRGEVISKIDAHGYPASDYLRKGTEYLCADESVKCVGGPIRPVGKNTIAKANAIARSSVFGVGQGTYSIGGEPRFVDTVQCGLYDRAVFEKIGLFDESLQFGEDEEINWRIRKRGWKILSTPEVRFFYFPRTSLGKQYQQYYNYGRARVKVIRKHPTFFRVKHVVPSLFTSALLLSGVLAAFSNLFLVVFLGIALLYSGVSLAVSATASAKEGWKYFGLLPLSFGALHFGYGMGFLLGLVNDLYLGPHRRSAKEKGGE
jgi:glycosyltransferase involved in cell wall biosynthesis